MKILFLAIAVLVPPLIGTAVILEWRFSDPIFLLNLGVLAIASVLWSVVAFWNRGTLFWGGLVGLHAVTIAFVAWAVATKADPFAWIFYWPAQIVGLGAGIILSRWFWRSNSRSPG